MKIIHTSDVHLDSALTTRLSPTEARMRKRELTAGFRKMIDCAVGVGAEVMIIAGDLFDNERVSTKTLESLLDALASARNVTFLYLPGNHERGVLLNSGIEIPKNLIIFGEKITRVDIGEISFFGGSNICQGMLDGIMIDDSRINVMILHGVLDERCSAPDRIGRRELAELPIDYVALGHYHSYSECRINDRTTAVYCGTPEGRGFDETGKKGFILLEVSHGHIRHEFCSAAARELHLCEVDVGGATRGIDIEDRIRAAIADIPTGDLVRVVLTGEYEPGLARDLDALSLRFKGSHFYIDFRDASRLRILSDDYKNDKSLKGEFIRLVMSKKGLTESEKAAVIECGLRAMAGEEI